MEDDTLNNLLVKENILFERLAKAYAYNNIPILMADHAPQRAGILSEFVKHGGKAYIAGGKSGQQFFKNVPQYTLPYDTFTSRDESSIKPIADCFPVDLLTGNLFATFNYSPLGDLLFTKAIKDRVGGNVIAHSEQNLRSFFEEKQNLIGILKMAGLEKNIIPSCTIKNKSPLNMLQSRAVYEKFSDKDGRIVLQYCGEGNTERGGGKSTIIANTFEEFNIEFSKERPSPVKVAKYISGCNSNVSICVGNVVPSKTQLGSVKGELLLDYDRFSDYTLVKLLKRGEALGINESNIIVNVQPATLKVVGDKHLTPDITNGVGNQLNYQFNKKTMDDIFEISQKFGKLMALCGKVGLCGLDLIISNDGIFINEINDRQQGPTESAGNNNERNGIPSIHKESFLMQFADIKNPDVSSFLIQMNNSSKEIYERAAQVASPFYAKVVALKDCTTTKDLQEGNYAFTNKNGVYTFDFSKPVEDDNVGLLDISQNSGVVNIGTVSAKKGEFYPKGSQIFRVNGVSSPVMAPFEIDENGNSVLSRDYISFFEQLQAQTIDYSQGLQEDKDELVDENNVEQNDEIQNAILKSFEKQVLPVNIERN